MVNRLDAIAEQKEALSREWREEVSRQRGVSPPKWDWRPGDVCFVRCHNEVYQDEVERVTRDGELIKLQRQSRSILANYVFESLAEALRHSMEDCISKRVCGFVETARE